MNGKQYGVGGIEKAKDISYDNTQSGMSATNVQGALDEVKAGLANLNSNLSNGAVLLGATSGTGTKTLAENYKNYRYIILVGFMGSNKIFPVMIHSLFLLGAGYALSVSAGGSDIFTASFPSDTTVNIISNPNQIRIYGIEKV